MWNVTLLNTRENMTRQGSNQQRLHLPGPPGWWRRHAKEGHPGNVGDPCGRSLQPERQEMAGHAGV